MEISRPIGLMICFLVMLFCSCDYYIINDYKDHIGVVKESEYETGDFSPCFPEKIFPYYYGRETAGFKEGKDSLRQYIRMGYNNQGIENGSGYITIRFIINCKGQAGLYELRQVGLDFKPKKFNPAIVEQIEELVMGIDAWQAIEFYGDRYDSFYHLSFKIRDGEIEEILP